MQFSRICHCGGILRRSRRRFFERLWCAAAFRCEDCQFRKRIGRWELIGRRKHVCCPECGEPEVRLLARRDGIDRMDKNPIRRLKGFLGAPLYHCSFCRVQFYDSRPFKPARQS